MGINKTVGWAWDIQTSFGGWVSSSCRTLISAGSIIPSTWRMAINRSAEAMTIFSVIKRFI
jgi:molybdopterin-containing oxidoreductase family membrane subunit